MRFVVDTNVAVVANGVPTSQDGANGRAPSIACRTASIEFLQSLLRNHKILLDNKGQIQNEYRRHLKPNGQPGTGDRFYLEVLNSHPDRVERVELPVGANGQYVDLPQSVQESTFDPSDRKFAALANKTNEEVVNSTDSDWLENLSLLRDSGIKVRFLCGCEPDDWYSSGR